MKSFLLADTALANVKLGELTAWLGRRNLSLGGIAGGFSRGEYNLSIYLDITVVNVISF